MPLASLFLARQLGVNDANIGTSMNALLDEGIELTHDIDTFTLDTNVDPNGAFVDATGTVKYHGASSWTTQVFTGRNDQAGPPPAIFWQAPKDADAVGYSRGVDPKLTDPFWKGVAKLAGALVGPSVPEADKHAIERVFADIPLYGTTSVTASGHIDAPAKAPAGKTPGAAPTPADIIKQSRDDFARAVGWHVMGVDGPAAPMAAWLRDLAGAANGHGVQALLKKSDADFTKYKPAVRTLPAPAGLPAGSMSLELSLTLDSDLLEKTRGAMGGAMGRGHTDAAPVGGPVAKGPAPKPAAKATGVFTLRIVVMPDGPNRTWIGVASDVDALKAHMAMAKSGAAKDGTIASRDDLAPIKNGSYLSAAYFTLGTSFSSLTRAFERSGANPTASKRDAEAVLLSLPHKGATPMFLFGTGTNGATPSNTAQLRVQQATIEDLVALTVAMVAK